ncbi:phd-finger domain-containing [Trichoderma arundinaceum]|uniref:Phd-finger domain-containing n=1 Tax=Trichoderma arundinaceum TaxID=490622 RepID=A0A395NIY1_TRIAR|nr:phd-finger domain-containing [Trichoderma arundinaceum]
MELLHRIRNMWQFANLCQWIYIFGDAAAIDHSIDVDCIEEECLKPNSVVLSDIALALLKMVSSQRGLTHASFDEQARKQYMSKSPESNPFGDEDAPSGFAQLDVFTKIKVMQQFTQWIMIRPELLREKMKEQKDTEQTTWRIEPYGWDSEDRTYYVLDDNRVYRLSELPSGHKASNSRSNREHRRSGKRRRISEPADDTNNPLSIVPKDGLEADFEDNHLGGMAWECVAVTLPEVQGLVESLAKSRDENEKVLRRQLRDHLVPILEKQEEERSRQEMRRERELQILAKLANAKRSSRIAMKAEQREKEERETVEREQLRKAAEAQQREEQQRAKIQKELEMRLVSREQRLKKREERRIIHDEDDAEAPISQGSEIAVADELPRQHQLESGESTQDIKAIQDEEEGWVFDCSCGLYGQVDDGNHSVACESCNVWQHSRCLGISEIAADHPDFHFICASCRQKNALEAASKSPPPIPNLNLEGNAEHSSAI